ncbi:MAG: NAD(+)/NADH kinase, partial [Terriglobales bacterium]
SVSRRYAVFALMESMPIPPGETVAIFVKPGHPGAPQLIQEVTGWLHQRGYQVTVAEAEGGIGAPLPAAGQPPRLAIVLGGDGTMLHAAPALARGHVPVLAVHLGTLGFMTETARHDLFPALERALAGTALTDARMMLAVRVRRGGREVASFLALNEAVVGKGALARLVQVDVWLDDHKVGRYRADGVLVATPTGSTAYSFSAGGPVVHPALPALLITPICPHALNLRSIAVGADATIRLEPAGTEPGYLTVDGQQGLQLEPGDQVLCTKSAELLQILTLQPDGFFQSLHSKLGWGL